MCLMDLGPVKERHLKSRKQEVYRRIRSQKTKVTGGTAWQSATDGKLWAWIEWFCLRLGLPAEGSTGPSKVKSVTHQPCLGCLYLPPCQSLSFSELGANLLK